MSIYITGDTHGYIDLGKLYSANFPARDTLTRDDYVIVAGDFGGLWHGDNRDSVLHFEKEPYTLLFVDGNHENFDLINSFPVEYWHGGKVHRIRENVIHLMRGQVYEIEGKTFFTFGGGLSIDRWYRTPGKSWWPQEQPSDEEMEEGLANYIRAGHVDFVVTHAAPRSVVLRELALRQHLIGAECGTENFLDRILNAPGSFGEWYFGHYHDDYDMPEIHMHELYQEIVKLV